MALSTAEFFTELVAAQKRGVPRAVVSVCSANRFVLEAAVEQAEADGLPVLIESTVNQVNQFGGYTGMRPDEFRAFVGRIAASRGLPHDRVILGGDHVGPYPWRRERAGTAMAKARDLVAASVRAGYTKIHLDASMPLGADLLDEHRSIPRRLVADREAELAAVAEDTFRSAGVELVGPPVYVIGTEVPPPGGITAGHGAIPVTRVDELLETVSLCRDSFRERGLSDAWVRTCAIVAQPGVEFGDTVVHEYDRANAEPLCRAAREVPGIVLEAHSTDYQRPDSLRRLVEDGVGVLKVGPALTFALRECLFGLEWIERELLGGRADVRLSGLAEALERAMLEDPTHWASYYGGSDDEQRRARRFSFSDRSRYYWTASVVRAATEQLLTNLEAAAIPLTLLSQCLPLAYRSIREAALEPEPKALLRASVRRVLADYSAATSASAPTRG